MLPINTMLIHKINLDPIDESKFRELHENIIFPELLSIENIIDTVYTLVKIPLKPVVHHYKSLELNKPVLVNGEIKLIWKVSDTPLSDDFRNSLIQELRETFDGYLNQLVLSYPVSEISSWAKQESEAKDYVLNNEAFTPLLDSLALSRGIAKSELAEKILNKSSAYATSVGKLIGTRQKIEKQILEATSVKELPEIPKSINFE
jgi:hypothetical protein